MKLCIWNIVVLAVISMAVVAPCWCPENPDDYFELQLQHDNGSFPIKVKETDTILELRFKVALYLGIPVLKQKLCNAYGVELQNDSVKLEELRGAYVVASELKPKEASVLVLTELGVKTVEVLEGDTVEQIKLKLVLFVGIGAFEQVITIGNSVLEDQWVYGSSDFEYNSIIRVRKAEAIYNID